MNVSFLHIGMMKTASTYMQQNLALNKEYSIQWGNNREYLYKMRENILKNSLVDINFRISPDQANKKKNIVISSEGFSTAFLNQPEQQIKIPEFIDYTSEQLEVVSKHTQNLLIVIRDPISWIKSIYIQSLKEGNSGNAQNFVNEQKNFIRNSLNLSDIVKKYGRFFSNILIMPYEILIENEDLFWGVISQSFNCPKIQKKIKNKINTSIDIKRSYLISYLNRQQKLVSNTIMQHSKEDSRIEKLVPNYLESGKWLNRWVAERATEKEIELLYRDLGISEFPAEFLKFTLDHETKNFIEKNYIGFLFENILHEFPQSYLENFKKSML